jgi:hypothetical protein
MIFLRTSSEGMLQGPQQPPQTAPAVHGGAVRFGSLPQASLHKSQQKGRAAAIIRGGITGVTERPTLSSGGHESAPALINLLNTGQQLGQQLDHWSHWPLINQLPTGQLFE